MAEIPKLAVFNRNPRHAWRYAAAAGVIALTGINSNSCSTGGDVVRQEPSIVRTNPATGGLLILDCVDYYKKTPGDAEAMPDSSKGYPRKIVFGSTAGTLFAANIEVKYGHEVYSSDYQEEPDLSRVATRDYWVAENNTGEAATTSYASDNDSLPDNNAWQGELSTLPKLQPDGTQLPNMGISPVDPLQSVIAQTSPYFKDNITGERTVYHDTGSLSVECVRIAKNGQPVPVPKGQSRTPMSQVLAVQVPPSTTETIPPAQS